MSSNIIDVSTQAFDDQKPGTSGLRKRVKVFEERPNYMENFIQSTLEAAGQPKFLVLGGDGRYYSNEAIAKILNVCAANGVQRLVVAQGGILSTPAASALIRGLKADGGIILTASHNPGGPEGDFGVKYNSSNGGPAPESLTNQIYAISQSITSYKSLFRRSHVQLDLVGSQNFGGLMQVDVVDPIENYLALMNEVFDLNMIKEKLFSPSSSSFNSSKSNGANSHQQHSNGKTTHNSAHGPFRMLADPINGVVGPYARKILVDILGAPVDSVINGEPLSDFGGKHPDPNLTYASELVDTMRGNEAIQFGVAFDGDGDRNMILGQGAFFVTPGDSLAVLAANLDKIKYFSSPEGRPIGGFARSFPTAPAVDRVAEAKQLKVYETPTGWKFFGNLMDAGLISLCGEESFGTGSVHIREKDGLWAALAWLSVMANTGKTVKDLVHDHWRQFGRDYFCRYDFEECDASRCQTMMNELEQKLAGDSLLGKRFNCTKRAQGGHYEVKETGNFEYKDPVDQSVASKQGLFVRFTNGARIIIRLSGTGSSGATVRLYVSDYSKESLFEEGQQFLADLLAIAYEISKLPEYTGRDKPTVIT